MPTAIANLNGQVEGKNLAQYGAIVINVLGSEEKREKWFDRLEKAVDEFPEYKLKGGFTVRRVLGGFGAYGNPSSFHHPDVRELRSWVKHRVAPIFRAYAKQNFKHHKDVKLEALYDRWCVRGKSFGAVTAESWHRDIYDPATGRDLRPLPKTLEGGTQQDIITGGWVNVGDLPQYFRGLVGTHNSPEAIAAQDAGGGFAMLSKEQVAEQRLAERLAAQANQTFGSCTTNGKGEIHIPPGHMLIFFQRLLHSVAPTKHDPQGRPSVRMFTSFRLTTELKPLLPGLDRVVTNGGVPVIPSGQMPAMFSNNHYAFMSQTYVKRTRDKKYREWAGKTFQPATLYHKKTKTDTYVVPGSPDDADPYANKRRAMTSLASYGMHDSKYKYSERDVETMTPQPLFATAPGGQKRRSDPPQPAQSRKRKSLDRMASLDDDAPISQAYDPATWQKIKKKKKK